MTAAIYCRLSDDAMGTGKKVEEQETDCRVIAAQRGWDVAHVLVDNDLSAWKRGVKRPGWDKLLELIRSKDVDAVVVWHPDRLMRQPRDLEALLDAADHGVKLASAGGGRDLSNPDDVFILRIETAHACRSSDDTSRRVRRGHLAAAQRGTPGGGGLRPFGYEPDRMTVREDEAEVIRDVTSRLLAGESLRSVVCDLQERKIPTARGGLWNTTTVRVALTRPRVAGLREHKGEIIGPAAWPAILGEQEWRDVCSLLNARRSGPARPVVSWLTGVIRCGLCGTPMQTKYVRHVRRYNCPTAERGGCGKVARNAEAVESLIDDLVLAHLENLDLVAVDDDQAAARRALEEQAERDKQFLLDLARRWGEGLISAEEYDAARSPVDARRKALAVPQRPRELRRDDPAQGWRDATPEQRKRIVRSLFEAVVVAPVPSRSARRVFDPDLVRVTWR